MTPVPKGAREPLARAVPCPPRREGRPRLHSVVSACEECFVILRLAVPSAGLVKGECDRLYGRNVVLKLLYIKNFQIICVREEVSPAFRDAFFVCIPLAKSNCSVFLET